MLYEMLSLAYETTGSHRKSNIFRGKIKTHIDNTVHIASSHCNLASRDQWLHRCSGILFHVEISNASWTLILRWNTSDYHRDHL